MKKGKIIGGVLSCLMLCGLLVGCSSNTDSSEGNTQSTTSSTVSTVSKNDSEATTVPYEKGTITETEFTSKWMGLKYTLPDDMYMMSEEYLESQSISGKVQMEMQAIKADDSGDNIVVLTEELSSLASIDEKRYLELSKPQIETLADKVMFDEVRQRIVAGETFYELPYHLSMEIDGTSVTLDQTFLCKKLDDRMICMTLTHSGENSINNLLAGFSKIS
ncbi:MAG: hypothetical protein UEE41_02215 [Acutalibacteraceae bacterium]|nr:hypothetical protein [Acutalibacteraceae bacterium]